MQILASGSMQPAVLLSLLAAVLVAAVSSVPVDSRNHSEEVVTRCIIEVLSNALSKSNPPPITPECRQILKWSGTEVKDEEKNGNENARFEVRLLRDQAGASEAHSFSDRENGEQDPRDLTRADSENRHSHYEAGETQGSHYASDSQVSKEANPHNYEKSLGEDMEKEGEKYQKGDHEDGDNEEKHLEEPKETLSAFSNKRNEATAKKKEELVSGYDKHSARSSEEMTHSRERSSQDSVEESTSQEKNPQESRTQLQSQEESEESEEEDSPEVDKRMRPRHHHERNRPDRNPPLKDQSHHPEQSEESNMDLASLGNVRGHYLINNRAPEEEPEYGEEIRNYLAIQPPKQLEGEQYRGRGSEEYRTLRLPSKEHQEEEDKINHLSSELDNMPPRYSEENEERRIEGSHQHRARGGELGISNKEEKGFLSGGYHRAQESQTDKAIWYPQSKWNEQDRNLLNYGEDRGEEGIQRKWQQQDYLQDSKENRQEAWPQGRQYAPYYISEKRKRLGELLTSHYDLPQWKNNHFERKSNMDDSYLEGEEENGLNLSEKNFFPEYNYDWSEKKPLEENVNWGYEKRTLAPTLNLKRQYDRVAELDQLLHYRKKAAEFPDFYDTEEQMTPRHTVENERDRIDQRVLTEEEEKELEDLAAMDLELQKIAEKFSGNRGD